MIARVREGSTTESTGFIDETATLNVTFRREAREGAQSRNEQRLISRGTVLDMSQKPALSKIFNIPLPEVERVQSECLQL